MPVRTMAVSRALVVCAALALPLAGCSEAGPTEPEVDPGASILVDASGEVWGYLDLATPDAAVTRGQPASSTGWDIAFNATKVILNGGANGPAGVVGLCLCQNETATNEQVLAMTVEGEAGDFEEVRAADVPAATDSRWAADVFDTKKWYRYNLTGNHDVSPTFEVFLVRRGSEVFKVQLTGYYGPAGETRRITVKYAKLTD